VKLRGWLTKFEMKLRPLQFGPGLGKLDEADGLNAIERANEAENPPPDWIPAEPDEEQ
jgi:hypothetical protein